MQMQRAAEIQQLDFVWPKVTQNTNCPPVFPQDPRGNTSTHTPMHTDVPVCPCRQHPHSSLTAFIGKSEAACKSSEAQRKQENKSGGFTLEMIKIKKNIPNNPEKLPFSRFLLRVDSDVPQPTISKSGDALKNPPDFKYNTVKDFIYLLTLELPGSIF